MSTKVIGVITARVTSTRLPNKVLLKLSGKTMFEHHVERMRMIEELDDIYLATSKNIMNDTLKQEAKRLDCNYVSGPEEDITERHLKVCRETSAHAILRVTCDCPLFDIQTASTMVTAFKNDYKDFIYCSNMSTMYGTLGEVISCAALRMVHSQYRGPAISLPIRENMQSYITMGIEMPDYLIRPEYRLTVDERPDFNLMTKIYDELYKGYPIDLKDVYTWLDDNPEISKINAHINPKPVNTYASKLVENPLFTIMKSGENGYVILNDKKKQINIEELNRILRDEYETY